MNVHVNGSERHLRAATRTAARLLALGCCILVGAALVVVVAIPFAVHGQAMTVLTGSMSPSIPVGSIVLVRPVDPSTLEVGDVATYQKAPDKTDYITHRVAEIDDSTTPAQFIFKGDANRGPDLTPVVPGQIRGEVWFHVPYLGAIRDALHGKGGISLVAMLVLAGYALSQIGAGLRDRKQIGLAGPVDLATDRALVAATFDVDRLAARLALTPSGAAAAWGAALVHQDEQTCTFLLAPTDESDLAARLAEMRSHAPRRLLVLEGPLTAVGRDAAPTPDQGGAERVSA